MSTLTLTSTELREPYAPRTCIIMARLESEIRDDLAMVRIYPVLPREVYDTADDIDWLILASRFEGESVFSEFGGPIGVYICRTKSGIVSYSKKIANGDLEILDWGQLKRE